MTNATPTLKSTPTDHPLWNIIRTVPDFPTQGIEFYDITPLLRTHISETIDALLAALPGGLLDDVDCFAAIEARGFIFASLLAGRTGKGMVLLRKEGKLPPPTTQQSYALEYGKDALEIQRNLPPERVLLVDDVLATGGTLKTAQSLCEEAGHKVLGMLVLIDIVALHAPFSVPLHSVLQA